MTPKLKGTSIFTYTRSVSGAYLAAKKKFEETLNTKIQYVTLTANKESSIFEKDDFPLTRKGSGVSLLSRFAKSKQNSISQLDQENLQHLNIPIQEFQDFTPNKSPYLDEKSSTVVKDPSARGYDSSTMFSDIEIPLFPDSNVNSFSINS